MQSVSPSAVARRAQRRRGAVRVAAALATATTIVGGIARLASAACPWIVQPHEQSVATAAESPAFDIVFDGLGQSSKVFYGFSVASLDLAWELANQGALPPLKSEARHLEAKAMPEGTTAYQLAPDTIRPHTIYLVAADTVVRELEQIKARIEPARPLAVSQLMPQLMPRTRGGSDWSGPLPRRSLPGFEIAGADSAASATNGGGVGPVAADLQICAYQVSTR